MSVLESYVLFILPAVICLAAGVGILVLKRGAKPKAPQEPVRVDYDFSNVTRLRASGEQ